MVLDWDDFTWNPDGSLSQQYNIDGVDVVITISGDTSNLVSGYPRIDDDITGGTSGEDALRLQLDLTSSSNSITVTIEFLTAVYNPVFTIYDIDAASSSTSTTWQDQISNIEASNGTVDYSPTISNVGSGTTLDGTTLTGNSNVSNDSSQANATISFDSGPVTQISFTYESGPNANANPNNQGIAISDISFDTVAGVPEINAVWVSIMALFLGAIVHSRRQRQSKLLPSGTSAE